MKFSKAWLQTYSKEQLPDTISLVDTITINAFEVEEVTAHEGDDILTIKVLPNRAHDALGHRGMARDVCALVGTTYSDEVNYYKGVPDTSIIPPIISNEGTGACSRFMGVRIDGVVVTESPEWLKKRLLAIGQKSINSIVDITNYVQFAINKPMHAYDTSLIIGNTLSARFARAQERLTTLDDKELILDEQTLIIADTEKPLGLAGIKGGKFSGISASTSSVILESANFNSTLIRKTSQRYGIRTDASKRFENELSDSLVEDGMRMTIAFIKELNPSAKVSALVDVYPKPVRNYHVGVSVSEINMFLGTSYTSLDVEEVCMRLGFEYKKVIPEEELLVLGNRVVGAPYHLGASVIYDAPELFDCSSLTSWLYVHAGIRIPRISIDQYVYTKRIESGDLRIGDLIFANNEVDFVWTTSKEYMPGTIVPSGINHVGLYLGDGNVLHATSMYEKVVIENVGTSPRFAHTVGYGRVMDTLLEERFVITVPDERLDIRIKEDLIEEIVRVKGLESITGTLPVLIRTGLPHKRLYYENKIKNVLYAHGFSDIMTYSFGDVGDLEIVKGLASDKEKLRSSLSSGVLSAFLMNMQNAPLLNLSMIKLFEFGNIFTRGGESRHFNIVLDDGKKKTSFKEDVEMVVQDIAQALSITNLPYEVTSLKPYCIEIDFDTLIAPLAEPSSYEPLSSHTLTIPYKTVSPYPFITRDIAMWVPGSTTWESVHILCTEVGNPLVVRIDLFDTFSKEIEGVTKTSYALRLVFQSHEKTLTDDEVNQIMEAYYKVLKEKGYEIR